MTTSSTVRDLLADRLDAARGDSCDDGKLVAESDGGCPDAGAGGLVERAPAQVIDAGAPFDREDALEDALDVHLPRIEENGPLLLGDAKCDGEGEGALPAPDVAPEHDQITAPEPPAKQLVEARESGGNGVDRRRTICDRVDAAEEERQRRDVGAARHCSTYGPANRRSKKNRP